MLRKTRKKIFKKVTKGVFEKVSQRDFDTKPLPLLLKLSYNYIEEKQKCQNQNVEVAVYMCFIKELSRKILQNWQENTCTGIFFEIKLLTKPKKRFQIGFLARQFLTTDSEGGCFQSSSDSKVHISEIIITSKDF